MTDTFRRLNTIRIVLGVGMMVLADLYCIAGWKNVFWSGPSDSFHQTTATLWRTVGYFTIPYVVLLGLMVFRKVRSFGIGMAGGLAVWAVNNLSILLIGGVLFGSKYWPVLASIILPHVFLVIAAALSFSPNRANVALVICGSIAAYVYMMKIEEIYRKHPQTLGMAVESTARGPAVPMHETIVKINACLMRYSVQNAASGFPKQLKEAEDGTALCRNLTVLEKASEKDGFVFRYSPSGIDSTGRVGRFTIEAYFEHPSEWSWYSDETGIIHEEFGRANKSSPTLEGAYTPVRDVGSLVDRLQECYATSNYRPVVLTSSGSLNKVSCTTLPTQPEFSLGGYHVMFRKSPSKFSLAARPQDYGISGLRSYFVDESFVIHATPYDRSATLADPPAPRCEFNPSSLRCVGDALSGTAERK